MAIDTQTVQKARAGDRAAFGELYDAVAKELYRCALYTLGNAADAEDAVADTFLDACKGIAGLRDPESFRPWIFRILSFKCRRKVGVYIRDRGNTEIEDYAAECETAAPDTTQERSEVLEAMAKLADDERQIVVMAVLDGYTMREIASAMDLPQGTVSSKLHRTLIKLRKLLQG